VMVDTNTEIVQVEVYLQRVYFTVLHANMISAATASCMK